MTKCLPHGPLSGVMIAFAVIAWIFTTSASFGCSFATASAGDTDGVGPWSGYNAFTNSCQGYPSGFQFNAGFKAGRAFTLLAFLFSLPALVGVCIMGCMALQKSHRTIVAGLSGLVGFWMLLAFSFIAGVSNPGGSVSLGATGILNVFGMLLWWSVSIMMCRIKDASSDEPRAPAAAPVDVEKGNQPTVTEEITVTENADGSKTKITKTTTTNADGTKTIEETKEDIPAQ